MGTAEEVDEAVPQEILVTAEVVDAAAACRFEPAGRRMVKGFLEPVTVYSLVDSGVADGDDRLNRRAR